MGAFINDTLPEQVAAARTGGVDAGTGTAWPPGARRNADARPRCTADAFAGHFGHAPAACGRDPDG